MAKTEKTEEPVVANSVAREKLLKQMTPAAREIAEELDKLNKRISHGQIMSAYASGELVARVLADESQYGAKVVEQLAAFVNLNPTTLYNYRNFADRFTVEFVKEWNERPMSSGSYLGIGHWVALMRVGDDKQVAKLLSKVIKDSLSTNDLELFIRSGSMGTRPGHSTGRSTSPPKSLMGGYQKYHAQLLKFLNTETSTAEHVFAKAEDLPTEQVSEGLIEKFKMTLSLVQKGRDALENDEKCIENLIEIGEKKLAEKKEAEGSDDDDADTPAKATKATKGPKVKPTKGTKAKGTKAKGKTKGKKPAAA